LAKLDQAKFVTRQKSDQGRDRAVREGHSRRHVLGLMALGPAGMALGGCSESKFHAVDVSGGLPSLDFELTRASDGKTVTQSDYRGQVVLLYFGYTFCPDVCPTTLLNVRNAIRRLGPDAKHVRVLFVTVDPNRDTLNVLADYVKNFGPNVEGLRGTADELASLARRYRFVYAVKPATADHPYEVSHSSTIYVFDASGAARLLVSSLATAQADIAGTAADLTRLVEAAHPPGLLTRIENMV
jgi:protein SCO1/2